MDLKETLEYMIEADNTDKANNNQQPQKNQNQKVDNTKENIKNLNKFIKTFDERINNVKKYFQAFETLAPYLEKNPENVALVRCIQSLKDSMTKVVQAYGDDKKGFKANSLKFLNSLENPNSDDAKKAQRNTSDALRKYKNGAQQNQNSKQDQNNSQQQNQNQAQQPAENNNGDK